MAQQTCLAMIWCKILYGSMETVLWLTWPCAAVDFVQILLFVSSFNVAVAVLMMSRHMIHVTAC